MTDYEPAYLESIIEGGNGGWMPIKDLETSIITLVPFYYD